MESEESESLTVARHPREKTHSSMLVVTGKVKSEESALQRWRNC